jgi:hypothetical protein
MVCVAELQHKEGMHYVKGMQSNGLVLETNMQATTEAACDA